MTAPQEDASGAVRAGEELNLSALRAWLSRHVPGLVGTPEVTQYSGGASNWTYRLRFDNDDLILRRPPAGTKAKSAHDMGREYRIQRALKPVFPYVPEMRGHCSDEAVIGAEFYVMERLSGIIPRRNLPMGVDLNANEVRRLCTRFLNALISLHGIDYQAAGLADIGVGTGYVRRQIEGWTRRYADARTWNVPRGRKVMRWLAANSPAAEQICIIHNDFRFDNVVLDPQNPTRIVGVLDWELATLGDPLMDLGNMLAYWVEACDDRFFRSTRRQPTTLPGMMTRREVIDYYCEQTGRDRGNWTFYEVYGLFRLSAIVQQIYYRYQRGQTRNPTFRHYWIFVHYLHRRCHRLMREAERR